jgi:hypothetical protein
MFIADFDFPSRGLAQQNNYAPGNWRSSLAAILGATSQQACNVKGNKAAGYGGIRSAAC